MPNLRKLLAAAAVILLVQTAPAVTPWVVPLSEEAVEALPEDARRQYERAMVQIDHINYDGGVALLAEAAELAPENTLLQFYTLSRARDRAEVYYSAATFLPAQDGMDYSTPPWRTAEVFLEIADSSIRRLQESGDLNTEQMRQLQRETELIEAGKTGLAQRDRQRLEAAAFVVNRILFERMEAMGIFDMMRDLDMPEVDALERALVRAPDEPVVDDVDPFALLPGEHREDFIPPAPPPQQYQQGYFDPYAGTPGFGPDPYGAPPGYEGGQYFGERGFPPPQQPQQWSPEMGGPPPRDEEFLF
jgi:hypothetical protein